MKVVNFISSQVLLRYLVSPISNKVLYMKEQSKKLLKHGIEYEHELKLSIN